MTCSCSNHRAAWLLTATIYVSSRLSIMSADNLRCLATVQHAEADQPTDPLPHTQAHTAALSDPYGETRLTTCTCMPSWGTESQSLDSMDIKQSSHAVLHVPPLPNPQGLDHTFVWLGRACLSYQLMPTRRPTTRPTLLPTAPTRAPSTGPSPAPTARPTRTPTDVRTCVDTSHV